MSATNHQQAQDAVQFLKIAASGTGLTRHELLWRWLQGDVQQWLSHEVLLIGWGDFRSGPLRYDLVSSLPGMRSLDWTGAAIAPVIGYFRDCWVAAQQQPCAIDASVCGDLVRSDCEDGVPASLMGMKTALVHGIPRGQGPERVFIAFSRAALVPAGAGMALKLLLPYIDTALRQMPAVPMRQSLCARDDARRHAIRVTALSERELQIMVWVAMGKTNPEIGMILDISEFTVKNHMKSIFGKLDVTNRAQAVAKLERMSAHA
jgi:transcriptional regulator EpsA